MASETEIVRTMDQILLAGHLDLERRFQQTSKTSLEGQKKNKTKKISFSSSITFFFEMNGRSSASPLK